MFPFLVADAEGDWRLPDVTRGEILLSFPPRTSKSNGLEPIRGEEPIDHAV